ncbi:alpha/beta hydrolase [Caldilinea sp.]|uniref:alpha/beta fold hydrolase n=1 Tax=Caldilinea sp. TaxID=2293560 RepID=UPI001B2BCA0C|nr:alpha/beta hydrolase [Caldilinea sp.]MBO9391323.1 alpha/beta hydrolase [Caldilinea sp.]
MSESSVWYTFETDTGAIAYEVISPQTGNPAPTLVLLHNFMSTGRAAWGPLLEQLSRQYRILLPDLPGHGRSIGHPSGFHHRAMAQQLAALLEHEGATEAHLAGCSSGGMLAQWMVVERLVWPATLTLVSTTYSVNPATTGHVAPLEPAHFQAGPHWMEATARLHDPYHYDGYYAEILLAGFRRLRPETLIDLQLEALTQFTMPVCLIHGAEDEFFPAAIPQAMAAALPRAELHLIPQQTHALIFRQPWRIAEIMVQFLNAHATADGRHLPHTAPAT